MTMDLKTFEENFDYLQRGHFDRTIIELDAEGMANLSKLVALYKETGINPHEMHPCSTISESKWKELEGYLDAFGIWHEEEPYRTFVLYEDDDMPESRPDKLCFYIKEWCICTNCGKQIDPYSWPMICSECSAPVMDVIQHDNVEE